MCRAQSAHSHDTHTHTHPHLHEDSRRAIYAYMIGLGAFLLSLVMGKYPLVVQGLQLVTVFLSGYHVLGEGLVETWQASRAARRFKPNTHLLMGLAAVGAILIGQFEEAALLILIFAGAHFLEDYAEAKSKKEMTSLLSLQPHEARLLAADGSVTVVPVSQLAVGDRVQVQNGAQVPIDGVIVKGQAVVNEAMINGESLPREKGMGDEVYAATLNGNSSFELEVTRLAGDTAFAKIVALVKEAQAKQSPVATRIQQLEPYYVTFALVLTVLYGIVALTWLQLPAQEAAYRTLVMLIALSPCALAASAIPATLAALSNLARRGVLLKGGAYLSQVAALKAIAFDKTGTLTQGTPRVTDVQLAPGMEAELAIWVSMERQANHPLATAIVAHFDATAIVDLEVINDLGRGLRAHYQGSHYQIAKPSLFETVSATYEAARQAWQADGKTVVYLAKDDQVLGALALMDTAKDGAATTIDYFNRVGVQTVMLTGDAALTGQALGQRLGIQTVHAQVLPDQKANHIQGLLADYETVAMVGDGVNDAPALATASLGIAMGQGTDVAMETADAILVKDQLPDLVYLHRLAKKLDRIVWQNIAFSLVVVVALALMNIGQVSNIALSVIGHEGSTLLVIFNGLRLLLPLSSRGD